MTLQYYAKEFLAITEYLKKSDACFISRNRCCVKKELLAELMNKNAYETVNGKLAIWKGLKWIDTDEDRFSKNIYDRQSKTKNRCIAIHLCVYETLKNMTGK